MSSSVPCRRCRALNPIDASRCHACNLRMPHVPAWGLAVVLAAVLLFAVIAALVRK